PKVLTNPPAPLIKRRCSDSLQIPFYRPLDESDDRNPLSSSLPHGWSAAEHQAWRCSHSKVSESWAIKPISERLRLLGPRARQCSRRVSIRLRLAPRGWRRAKAPCTLFSTG